MDELTVSLPSIEDLNDLAQGDRVAESKVAYGDQDGAQCFKRLVVWQESMRFVAECYRITSSFPKSETYGLTRQLRDATFSVSLNIAEGWGRNGRTEFARFCGIARASLQEVDSAFELAALLTFVEAEEHSKIQNQINRLSAMLLKLINKLKAS